MAEIASTKSFLQMSIQQQSNDLREIERSAWIVAIVVLAFITALAIGCAFDEKTFGDGARVFLKALSIGIASGAAAAAIGSMLGFLFGIPRLLQKTPELPKPGDPDTGRTNQFFITNTSLEEISDWLTKIIIGLSLVQFETIIRYIYIASLFAASYIKSVEVTLPAATEGIKVAAGISVAFFFAIIVICLLGACLFIYLETRTRLTRIFRQAELDNVGGGPNTAFEALLNTPLSPITPQTPTNAREQTPITPLPPTEKPLAKVPWEQLTTATQIGGWAVAQARSGNVQPAEDALRDALKREPGNPNLLQRLAELRRSRGNPQGFVETSIELIQKSVTRTPESLSLLEGALVQALYLAPPDGFSRAITISDFLVSDPNYKEPLTFIRRACAFAQKFLALKNAGSSKAGQAREKAREAVKTVVDLVPDVNDPYRVLLRQLLDPQTYNGNPRDDDLAVFANDEAFRKLIIEE